MQRNKYKSSNSTSTSSSSSSLASTLTSIFASTFTSPGFRRYGANTAWLFAEQILRMIAGFLVGLWVARYLGPEKYGLSICPTGVENLKICQNYIDFNVGGDFK